MSSFLLDHLRSVFSPTSVSELAQSIGEATAPTQKALDGLIPTVTAGVINRVSDQEGAIRLYQLLADTSFATDPTMSQLVGTGNHRQKSADSGNALLNQLYSDRPTHLAESTAQYSGVGLGSASTLTGLVMSVLMGFLHQQVRSRNLTQTQLTALLLGETDSVRSAIPAVLAGSLGWLIGTPLPASTRSLQPETAPVVKNGDEPAGAPWWRWLLLALALLLLLFFLLRGCQDEKITRSVNSSTVTDSVASDLDGNEAQVRVGVDLPGGRKLSLVEHSFNDSLARYLANKNSQTPRLFTFDNLTFETNSARITAQARPHVDDLIQIMQAYPSLAIRIEGNTDSTGDDALNDPLSAQRASVVKQALIQGGIAANRVTTRERGDTKPVASNQTPAGRQKNRRIDVVITKL
ncbi:OmpA family protein [Spirosoma sp. HMF4905]|uniref:OmpA family protein n=1 Tax=Spirosoma arboris TaxID=2682092 RepID=A0A7K1SF78_9BACT|nr:OmpA family protein [Spirosoma arboris]MVM32469.1 OmpA family protein [Spirosoma arboris]